MPIGEITGELLEGLFRILGYIFIDVIFEILIKGLGYLVCRQFTRTADPDGLLVCVVGIACWAAIVVLAYLGSSYVVQQMKIDACLDKGGAFDYVIKYCIEKNV